MNVLVTGRGKAGSWAIRGEQLGRAAGFDVMPMAIDLARYDAVVVVKRVPGDIITRAHAAGARLIWDQVDSWPQPEGNRWGRAECLAWLRGQIHRYRPAAIIAATRRMAADVREVCDLPVAAIPHHGRPGLKRTEIREALHVVAYEGNLDQLGEWAEVLERLCRKRHLRLVFNPASLNDADVVVALRHADGYAARHWKSNVKLANAQATGTPAICVPESGYGETSSPAGQPLFVEDEAELARALDLLAPRETRQAMADGLYAQRIKLATVAQQYREFIGSTCTAPSY